MAESKARKIGAITLVGLLMILVGIKLFLTGFGGIWNLSISLGCILGGLILVIHVVNKLDIDIRKLLSD